MVSEIKYIVLFELIVTVSLFPGKFPVYWKVLNYIHELDYISIRQYRFKENHDPTF